MKQLIPIIFLVVTFTSNAEVYKWTDKQGNVHYSDTPGNTEAESETIKLPPGSYYSPPTPSVSHSGPIKNLEDEQAIKKPKNYRSARIVSPKADGTVRDNRGYVPILLRISPRLYKGDRVQLLLDGKPYGKPVAASSITLKNIDRGTHAVSFMILDSQGLPKITSNSVTFHLHRHHK